MDSNSNYNSEKAPFSPKVFVSEIKQTKTCKDLTKKNSDHVKPSLSQDKKKVQ